ncbi:sulfurtransferase complex subunit TusD [Buchnera aphidicola]|uniref:Sulfurtransferase complex subunit TusD n=1 Tax=Buchnera aphidicola (Sarucallis kahawaluokalani) TaxID=1241878 RepID=A0A4D6YAG9_9GAMM|nr:sulfurtransferase complex subunit TusD [Buchnera aphidicola]QCI26142.1 sulfurtransferase complex subunit TusD [Buchnera aphidicola (Sarucallis kahawaluokalani)]
MLVYTILVTSSVLESQNSRSAFLFVNSLLHNTSHSIHSIFFYSNGAFNGTTMIKIDEIDLSEKWYKLSKIFSINLYICSTAAQDRGIIPSHIKQCTDLHENIRHGFQLAGLGQLIYAILNTDRFLQF